MKRSPEQIEELLDKMESILSEYDSAKDRFDRNEWGKKFGDRFGAYSDKLKTLNGDDFDILKESYDEYHNDYSDLSDDDYANALEENIKKVLARIWPEATEEQKEEVAQEVADSVESDGEATVEVKSEPEVSVNDEPIEDDDKDADDSAEKEFYKELESYMGK